VLTQIPLGRLRPPRTRTSRLRTEKRTMLNAEEHGSEDVIAFGSFRLFVAKRLLERRVPVHLGRRALDILLVLVEHATEVVSKEDLVAIAWRNLTVKEASFRFHLAALRKALGEGRSAIRCVTNGSGRGYCFVAPVSRATLTPSAVKNVPPARTAQLIHENSNLAFTSAARSRSSRALGEQRLQRVLEFVEANLETDISVDDLASVALVSKFHFSRAFRRATGQTPHHFVRARRLEKAKELLVKRDLTLAGIALICNFSSQESFTKVFSRTVGLPLGEYRRQRRQTGDRGLPSFRKIGKKVKQERQRQLQADVVK